MNGIDAQNPVYSRDGANQCEGPAGCQSYEFCNIDPTGGNKCLGCTENCITCLSKTNCTQCADGSAEVSGVCIKCNTIVDGQACQCGNQKFLNCTECSRNGCGACLSDYFVDGEDMCQKKVCSANIPCQNGQFCQIIPNTLNKCVDCGSGCDSCDQTACQRCLADFKLVDGHCLKNQCDDEIACQAGFFCQDKANVQNTCIDCKLFPDQCESKKSNLIPIIAGVVSGVVVLLIVLIIVIVVIKKRKSQTAQSGRDNAILKNNQSSSNMTNGSQQYI